MIATLAVAAWVTIVPRLAHAAATPVGSHISIHRYADFSQQALASGSKSVATLTGHVATQRVRLNVYGKSLALQLQDHSTLLGRSSPQSGDITLLRGNIEGVAHSWVRLTQVASGTHGLIWDGAELYVIEPSAEVGDQLDDSLPVPAADTIIFRLSDTTLNISGDFCAPADMAHSGGAITGLATYQALTAELTQPGNLDNAPTLRLEMQVLADAAFRAVYNSDQAAIDALVVRLNNVDGIYSAQLGLAVQATSIRLLPQDPPDLSSSTDADTLLNSLAQMRVSTPGMSQYAATHLFTGRDLDGDTLGIAYIGNLCGARYAASLSESRNRGAWIDSLVTAHELGHQLGAVHDGTGVCSSTATEGYLMSSLINGNDTFSSCSRDAILATMRHAACLVPTSIPASGGVTDGTASNTTPATSEHSGGGALTLIWLLIFSALAGWQLRRRTA